MKRVFPDTNVLMHFNALECAKWRAIAGADEIEVVIAASVSKELNTLKHKSDTRHRAQTVTKQLITLFDTSSDPKLPGDVPIVAEVEGLAGFDFASRGLDPEDFDDRFIASVLRSREARSDNEHLIVSNDFNMRLKTGDDHPKARRIDRAWRDVLTESEVLRRRDGRRRAWVAE